MIWEKYSTYFKTSYNLHHLDFYRTDRETVSEEHQKDDYSLYDSIYNFLLHYNYRLNSIIKVASYKAMMNAYDKELMEKNKENIVKRRLKEY